METYADFVSTIDNVVGSYVDAEGTYHAYLRGPGGSFATLDLPLAGELDYFFLHGINDALIAVGRAKAVGDVPPHLCRQPRRPTGIAVSGQRQHGGLECQSGRFYRRTL